MDAPPAEMKQREFHVPRAWGEVCFVFFLYLFAIGCQVLIVISLMNRIALFGCMLNIAFWTLVAWIGIRNSGGVKRWLVDWLGLILGRKFVRIEPDSAGSENLRFGYRFFGHDFYQKSIALKLVESVEWDSGQATDMSGRDQGDWTVFVWYDRMEPSKRKTRKPHQDILSVGS